MNWVGGARNRVKGNHRNELRLQKEYFERKRSELNNLTRETNSAPNTVIPKKSKLSQDVISFQRKYRMNNRQGIRPDQNYRRVDFNSRNFSNVTDANRFGVKSVELPLSPIQEPSQLQINSPPWVNRNQGMKPIAKEIKSNHRSTYHCSVPAENNSYLQLFGEPVVKHQNFITTINKPYNIHHCSPCDMKIHSAMDTVNDRDDAINLYSPIRHSRDLDFSLPFSSEMKSANDYTTESYSFCSSINEQRNIIGCHDNVHILPHINEISRFQVDPHYQKECKSLDSPIDQQSKSSVCSSHKLFRDNSNKDNFSVHIVPSPVTPEKKWSMSPNSIYDDQSSETLNWSQAVDNGISEFDFNNFQLPEGRAYSNNMSTASRTCYPDEICHGKISPRQVHKQFATLIRDSQEIINGLPKTHMTNIKETHRKKKASEYSKWQKYFPRNEVDKRLVSPSYIVSNGLDRTPETRNANDLEPINNLAPCMSSTVFSDKQNCLLETKTENVIVSIDRYVPCNENNGSENLSKTTVKKITTLSHEILPSPVERQVKSTASVPRNKHISSDTVQKEKKNVLTIVTKNSSNVAPTSDSILAVSNTIVKKKVLQDQCMDEEEIPLKTRSPIESTPELHYCDSLYQCNRQIKQSRDSVKFIANEATSSEYVYDDNLLIADDVSVLSTSRKHYDSITSSTQTTPVMLIDTATSPIQELVIQSCLNLDVVNGCNISSSKVELNTTK